MTTPYWGSSPVVNLAMRTAATLPTAVTSRTPTIAVDGAGASRRGAPARPRTTRPGRRARRRRTWPAGGDGVKHPVHDFLFTYYSFGPRQLRRWHPGTASGWPARSGDRAEAASTAAAAAGRAAIRTRCSPRPRSRPANFGCFGLHEWAMVYRQRRRPATTGRCGSGRAGTDEVVESHRIACSHFDAFRFFTPTAAAAQHAVPRPRRPGGVRAAGLPAREDGPLQARVPAVAAGRLRPGRRLLRAGARHPRARHARVAVRPRRPGLRRRSGSRPPRASRSTPPRSAGSPTVRLPCATGWSTHAMDCPS